MLDSVVAVVGTLLGSVAAYVFQQRAAREAARENRADERRRDTVTALTQLAGALADHRRAMWVREDLRLSGTDQAGYQAARAASHATRSALTAPLVTVGVLAPHLAAAANRAAAATYALRGAVSTDALATARQQAVAAAEQLVSEAAQQL